MRIAPANNNRQQDFGMLKFRRPLDSKNEAIVQFLMDVELPFAKRIPVRILDAQLGEYAVDSTPKNLRLLELGLEKLGASPKFIDDTTRLSTDPPDYIVPENIKMELGTTILPGKGPLAWLAKYLDRMSNPQ